MPETNLADKTEGSAPECENYSNIGKAARRESALGGNDRA